MPEELKCSFCGKNKEDVDVLIKSKKKIYICNECVLVCNDILINHYIRKSKLTQWRRTHDIRRKE